MQHKGTAQLETGRLILRRFTPEDAEATFRNWASDERVTKYLSWQAHSDLSVAESVVRMWAESYNDPTVYQWAIVPKKLGEPIGSISVTRHDDSTEKAEIGYCIGCNWWHKGYTSEALQAVIAYLIEEVGAGRVEAMYEPENARSGAVMLRSGMTYEGTLRKAGRNNRGIVDVSVCSILREEYLARKS